MNWYFWSICARMPREVQQIAFDKGVIPYIPADQEEKGCRIPGANPQAAPYSLISPRDIWTAVPMR